MSRRCGSSKPAVTPLIAWLWSKENAKKRVKRTQILQPGKPPIKPLPHTAGVAGRGAEKALRQTNHKIGTMARRARVDMEGNTGASTREKSYQSLPAGHWHGGRLDEETTNTWYGRWHHLQPLEVGKCLAEKKVEQIQHTKKTKNNTQAMYSPVPRYAGAGYPGRPPALD